MVVVHAVVHAGASKQSAGLRTPGRSRASSMRREGSSGWVGPGTAHEQESARSRTTISGGSISSAAAVQETVAAAVRQMQQNLQEDLHDERYRVKGLLGRGGFGTVYRGTLSLARACVSVCLCLCLCLCLCFVCIDQVALKRALGA